MNQTNPTPIAPEAWPEPPAWNPAVQYCCESAQDYLKSDRAKRLINSEGAVTVKREAAEVYRQAMPNLSDYESIRDFIACVTHGMLIGFIDAIEGPKFLYAAQVASGLLRHQPKEQKQPAAGRPTPHPPTQW